MNLNKQQLEIIVAALGFYCDRSGGEQFKMALDLQEMFGNEIENQTSPTIKNFTKADLRDGDELVYRCPLDTRRFYKDDGKIVNQSGGARATIGAYTDNLRRYTTHKSDLDIVEIIRNGVTVYRNRE